MPQSAHGRDERSLVSAPRGAIPDRHSRRRLVGMFARELLGVWQTYGAKPALIEVRDVLMAPLHRRLEARFDRRYGLETAGVAPLASLSLLDRDCDDRHDRRRYEAVPLVTFARMMSRLPADLSDYAFVDFGSGKGRALLLAARYGFKRIIGVEFAAELHRAAERNVEASRRQCTRPAQIELINQNAVCFPIPDEKCVFYFFNPFGDRVLAQVISNIEESYGRRPRKMFFLYVNPHGAHVLDGRKFVRVVERRRFGLKTGAIYETAGPA
jgi:hypothetical protein